MQIYLFSFLLFVSSLKHVFIYLLFVGVGFGHSLRKSLVSFGGSQSQLQLIRSGTGCLSLSPSFISGTWSALLCSLGWSHTHKRLFLLHFLGNSSAVSCDFASWVLKALALGILSSCVSALKSLLAPWSCLWSQVWLLYFFLWTMTHRFFPRALVVFVMEWCKERTEA